MRNPIVILVSCFFFFFLMNLDLYSQVPLAYSITLEKRDRVKKTLTFKAVIRNVSKSDLIIDRKGHIDYVEIKKTSTLKQTMLATLKQFKPEQTRGVLIYKGKTEHFPAGISAINYEEYLQRD